MASFVYGRKVRLYCNVCIVIDGPSVRLSTMLPFLGRIWDEDGLLGTDKDALWQAIHVNRLLCYVDGPDRSTGCVGLLSFCRDRSVISLARSPPSSLLFLAIQTAGGEPVPVRG